MLNTSAAAADLTSGTLFSGHAGLSRVAVAVSGGSDSMALLVLAADWAKVASVELVALTVDHGLRTASAGEAQQVSKWSQTLLIPHYTLKWEGEKPASGIQAAARTARYDLMAAWCREQGFDVILTAHTMEDQAETVAMRAKRTASPRSLSGIWPEMNWQGVRVVRPLLSARREDLRQLLRQRGQPWIDDPSNEDERFERVRHRKAMLGSEVAGLAGMAGRAQATTLDRDQAAAKAFSAVARTDQNGCVWLDRAAFRELETIVACDVLSRSIYIAGSGQRSAPAQLDDLAGWIAGPSAGRRTLAGAVVALRWDHVLVTREAGRIAAIWQPVHRGMVWDGRFFVEETSSGVTIGPSLLAKQTKKPADIPVFVWNGLPVLRDRNGTVVTAAAATEIGVSVGFRERKWF